MIYICQGAYMFSALEAGSFLLFEFFTYSILVNIVHFCIDILVFNFFQTKCQIITYKQKSSIHLHTEQQRNRNTCVFPTQAKRQDNVNIAGLLCVPFPSQSSPSLTGRNCSSQACGNHFLAFGLLLTQILSQLCKQIIFLSK